MEYFTLDSINITLNFDTNYLQQRYDSLHLEHITSNPISILRNEIYQSFQSCLKSVPENDCVKLLTHLDTTIKNISTNHQMKIDSASLNAKTPFDLVVIGIQELLKSILSQTTNQPDEPVYIAKKNIEGSDVNTDQPISPENNESSKHSKISVEKWQAQALSTTQDKSLEGTLPPFLHIRKGPAENQLRLQRGIYVFNNKNQSVVVGESMKKISASELMAAIHDIPGANIILIEQLLTQISTSNLTLDTPAKFLLGQGGNNRVFLLKDFSQSQSPTYYAVRQSTIASPTKSSTELKKTESNLPASRVHLENLRRSLPKPIVKTITGASDILAASTGPFFDASSKSRNARISEHAKYFSTHDEIYELQKLAKQRPDTLTLHPLALGAGSDLLNSVLDTQDSMLFTYKFHAAEIKNFEELQEMFLNTPQPINGSENKEFENLALLGSFVKTASTQLSLWLISKMIDAVSDLHQSQLGHSDIKLDNYLIEGHDEGLAVKLADIDDIAHYTNTRTAYTPNYHPEQPPPGRRITIQANDVYGVVHLVSTQLGKIKEYIDKTNAPSHQKQTTLMFNKKHGPRKKIQYLNETIKKLKHNLRQAKESDLQPQALKNFEAKINQKISIARTQIYNAQLELTAIENEFKLKLEKAPEFPPLLVNRNLGDDEPITLEKMNEQNFLNKLIDAQTKLNTVKQDTVWSTSTDINSNLPEHLTQQQEFQNILLQVQGILSTITTDFNMANYSPQKALEHQLLSAAVVALVSPTEKMHRAIEDQREIKDFFIKKFAPSLTLLLDNNLTSTELGSQDHNMLKNPGNYQLSSAVQNQIKARGAFLNELVSKDLDSDLDIDEDEATIEAAAPSYELSNVFFNAQPTSYTPATLMNAAPAAQEVRNEASSNNFMKKILQNYFRCFKIGTNNTL